MIHKHGTKSTMEDFTANKWSGRYNWPDPARNRHIRAPVRQLTSRRDHRYYATVPSVFSVLNHRLPCPVFPVASEVLLHFPDENGSLHPQRGSSCTHTQCIVRKIHHILNNRVKVFPEFSERRSPDPLDVVQMSLFHDFEFA